MKRIDPEKNPLKCTIIAEDGPSKYSFKNLRLFLGIVPQKFRQKSRTISKDGPSQTPVSRTIVKESFYKNSFKNPGLFRKWYLKQFLGNTTDIAKYVKIQDFCWGRTKFISKDSP